jgi:hypothetical protein
MGFEGAYRFGDPPWNIGRAQPAIVRLAAEGLIAGDVIDVGCGTGENAIHLASRGLAVVGVDAASTAQSRQGCKHVIEPMLLMTPVRELRSVDSVRRGHRPSAIAQRRARRGRQAHRYPRHVHPTEVSSGGRPFSHSRMSGHAASADTAKIDPPARNGAPSPKAAATTPPNPAPTVRPTRPSSLETAFTRPLR